MVGTSDLEQLHRLILLVAGSGTDLTIDLERTIRLTTGSAAATMARMPFVCDLCGDAIANAQPRITCTYEPYSDSELAPIFGHARAYQMSEAYRCHAVSHPNCRQRLGQARTCCDPPEF